MELQQSGNISHDSDVRNEEDATSKCTSWTRLEATENNVDSASERSVTPTSSNESYELVQSSEVADEFIDEEGDSHQVDEVTKTDSIQSSTAKIESIPSHTNNSTESILQCLLRLHKEGTLYKGASHMTTTLMISNFIFFYALQVSRQSLSYIQQHEQQRQQRQQSGRRHQLQVQLTQQQLQTTHHVLLHLHRILKSKMATSLISSTIAGMINVILTNPLWVGSLRIMEGRLPQSCSDFPETSEMYTSDKASNPSLWSVINDIAQSEGKGQLWSGTSTSLLLVSNPIIQHFVYEQLRSWLLGRRNNTTKGTRKQHHKNTETVLQLTSLTALEAFIFGALAKAVATVLTYPLQLAQVLLRLQTKRISPSDDDHNNITSPNSSSEREYKGTIDCLRHQFVQGGIPALFVGMNAKLLQTVLTSAMTFLTYEQVLIFVGRVYAALK